MIFIIFLCCIIVIAIFCIWFMIKYESVELPPHIPFIYGDPGYNEYYGINNKDKESIK